MNDQFLRTVVTTPEGWFVLCMGTGLGEWHEEFYHWPEEVDKILARAEEQSKNYNIYFSAHLFKTKSSSKANVLPTRTIQADLDDAALNDLTITPTVLVETSPGRHQAYWVLDEDIRPDLLEIYSQNLTYSIPLCDRTGWPLGHKVRVPETFNYKRLPDKHLVRVLQFSGHYTNENELELIPGQESYKLSAENFDVSWLDSVDTISISDGPLALLEKIKTKIPPRVAIGYKIESADRSAALWALLCAAFRTGLLSRDEVFVLAKNSENNKFASLKYHGNRELGKDVLRAEETVHSHVVDLKKIINEGRRLPNCNTAERRQYISKVVLERMKVEGTFTHCEDGSCWYTRTDLGRPVHLTARSEYLRMLLAIEFGLNEAETEQHYVVNELQTYCLTLPDTGQIGTLTTTDLDGLAVLLHTGRKEVLRITASTVISALNGTNGVLFPWPPSTETFRPNLNVPNDSVDWAAELFDESLGTVQNVSKEEARAILKVWFLFILFRGVCPSRPILALFGQPGAGKSTIFKKIYALLYGQRRSLLGITNREDFDHAVSSDCLVVLDNVDTWESWLPDRLALSAGTTDLIKRRLYSDTDTVVLRRQALLGITAHNPQFAREDVADRLLILTLGRLPKFKADSLMLTQIAKRRNLLWGAIVRDIQKILGTEQPTEYPQLRIEDFARIGSWLAAGVGCTEEFTTGLKNLVGSQEKFVLNEDQLLVDALWRLLQRHKGSDSAWYSAASLWAILEPISPDPHGFVRRYRNAVTLAKKMNAFRIPLSNLMQVESQYDTHKGITTWRFSPLEGDEDAATIGKTFNHPRTSNPPSL